MNYQEKTAEFVIRPNAWLEWDIVYSSNPASNVLSELRLFTRST